jgi:uncharacterized protein (DUF362 family)
MVRQAVERAGGLDWMPRGSSVLVKPNVNSNHEHPGTTNPEVLAAVLDLVKERAPERLIVADRSNPRYGTRDAMNKLGLLQAAQEAGAEVLALEEHPWHAVKPDGAAHWPDGFEVPTIMDEIDVFITLPVVKAHFIATYTMALKNSVGLIHPNSRSALHRRTEPDFGAMISEIHLWRRPDFIVLDATRTFVSGGPSQGQMVEPSLILAGNDPVAADATGLALLKTLGTTAGIEQTSLWAQPQIARAVELELGSARRGNISLIGESIAEINNIDHHLNS